MNEASFHFLLQRPILDILIGDTQIAEGNGYKIKMPYLSGPELVIRSNQFGLFKTYGAGGQSRWQYMQDLLTFSIKNERTSDLLAFWFDRKHFQDLTSLNDTNHLAKAYNDIFAQVIEAINKSLFLGGHKLAYFGKKFQIIEVDATPVFSVPSVQNIDAEYIRSLPERCIDDMAAENFDSVITKSRTLIEEVLIFILEKHNIDIASKGDIKKLYGQFKIYYNMNANKGFEERINKLLSGLETILQSIAEMRNMNSDAHGVGKKRITIKKRDAQLVINTAIIFSEYLLETHKYRE